MFFKKSVICLGLLFSLGCAAKLTNGQKYTMDIGTYVMATRLMEQHGMFEAYCFKASDEGIQKACSEIAAANAEICANIQYDSVERIVRGREDLDLVRNVCKEYSK